MMSLREVIENQVNLDQTELYAAILGESPSRGAKSPSLWNAAFTGLGLSGIMHPLDIHPARLEAAVEALRQDERFIGGAVTMPYKIDIIPFLDKVDPEAETIGAVNCLYREGRSLAGTNTDGAAALWSLEDAWGGSLTGLTVLLIGTGGAGCAVAAYVAQALEPTGALILANRTTPSRDRLAERLSGKCRMQTADWPVTPATASRAEVLINCTSLGFETLRTDARGAFSLKPYTPLGPVDDTLRARLGDHPEKEYLKTAATAAGNNFIRSWQVLAGMNEPLVFDIIYQPPQTMLLYLAGLMKYRILNGVAMNLEQAVIAFDKATAAAGLRSSAPGPVREFMLKAY